MVGESRSGTIIKLADSSPGFSDPSNPNAFIHARHPQQQGEQNMVNYFYHLTIEFGRGNAGAVALNYHTNNTGAVKDVAILATDPVGSPGHVGLGLLDWEVGPGNGRYITVRNCEVGVKAHSATSIRKLNTENSQTPLIHEGMLVLLDSTFNGDGQTAVQSDGERLARNIITRDYKIAIASNSPADNAAGPECRSMSHNARRRSGMWLQARPAASACRSRKAPNCSTRKPTTNRWR